MLASHRGEFAANGRGGSKSLSMRPLALLSVVTECSKRESGGFSFRAHKLSRSKDLKTLDPRQHRSGRRRFLIKVSIHRRMGLPANSPRFEASKFSSEHGSQFANSPQPKAANSPGLSFRFWQPLSHCFTRQLLSQFHHCYGCYSIYNIKIVLICRKTKGVIK